MQIVIDKPTSKEIEMTMTTSQKLCCINANLVALCSQEIDCLGFGMCWLYLPQVDSVIKIILLHISGLCCAIFYKFFHLTECRNDIINSTRTK